MRKAQIDECVFEVSPDERAQRLSDISRKDREFHRQNAQNYDHAITSIYSMYHQCDVYPWIRSVVERQKGGQALDIGTGTGVVASALAEAGLRVYAVDHSQEMLTIAQRKLRSIGCQSSVIRADVLRLPFDDNAFNVVTMQGILHHVPIAINEVVTEAMRVLSPGGEFYISEPCADLSFLGRCFRFPLWYREYDPEGDETDEEAIVWAKLAGILDQHGLIYSARFLTHIPSRHFHYWLPDRVRIAVTRALSFPFSRGDLLFVHGRKHLKPEAQKVWS